MTDEKIYKGLSAKEVQASRRENGSNQLSKQKRRGFLHQLLSALPHVRKQFRKKEFSVGLRGSCFFSSCSLFSGQNCASFVRFGSVACLCCFKPVPQKSGRKGTARSTSSFHSGVIPRACLAASDIYKQLATLCFRPSPEQ